MLNVRESAALHQASEEFFREDTRQAEEDNLNWIQRQMRAGLGYTGGDEEVTWLLLLGGTGIYHQRLREAQRDLRADRTRSHWSHAVLLCEVREQFADSLILETSLEPLEGFGMPTAYNGVQGAVLSRYADPREFPNVAVIRVPVLQSVWFDDGDDHRSVLTSSQADAQVAT